MININRVAKVVKGGKRFAMAALVIIGDGKGRVGYGVAKGKDVQFAVEKSARQAKKNLITVPIVKGTIPHAVFSKFKAAQVLLKPAPVGSGIIAGGAVRVVLELAGVPNVSSKIMSRSKNKISLVKSTFEALSGFKRPVANKVEEKK